MLSDERLVEAFEEHFLANYEPTDLADIVAGLRAVEAAARADMQPRDLARLAEFDAAAPLMPSNPTLPEDVLETVARAAYAYSWGSVDEYYEGENQRETRAYIDAIAPLIIEWARKDQAEVDAQIAREMDAVEMALAGVMAGKDVAAAIRAQFTLATTGGTTNG